MTEPSASPQHLLRAPVFTGPGEPLSIEDLEIDGPRAGEVAVRMLASGVCHSDLHVLDGDWAIAPPLILGHEGCGRVTAVGTGVSSVAVGDKVVLSWYYPCGRCRRCHRGRPWQCTGTTSPGNRMADGTSRIRRRGGEPVYPYLTVGSFGERAVVPEAGAVAVAAELAPEIGALIGCAVSTGVGAVVNTARVEPGQSVVVIGCGGVGLSIVMGAALAGADPIIAVEAQPPKLDLARDLGATHALRSSGGVGAAIRAICPDGPDFAFEAIGTRETIELALGLLGRGGTAVLVGLTAESAQATIAPFTIADQAQSVLGSNYGSTRPAFDFPRLAALHLAGRLPIDRMISERIAIEDVDRAFAQMRAGDGARRVVVHRSD